MRGVGPLSSSPAPLRWLRHAVILVTVLYVAFNLAARSPFADRLLPQRASAGALWQQFRAAPVSTKGDDSGGIQGTGTTLGGSTQQANDGAGAGAGDGVAPRPAAFDQCGTWQEAYMERHRKILAGKLPERYLVAVLHDAGVADQLLGVITAFYWALLTDRAFQLTTGHQQLPPLEAAFDAPFIDWSRPLDPIELTERLYISYKESEELADAERAYPTDGSVDTARYASIYLANNNTHNNELFRATDLRTVFPDHAIIFTASNRGRTYRLFDNPHHRRALARMGLRPETAFGCAFRFLFKPNNAVMHTDAMQLAKKELRSSSSVFKDGRDVKADVVRIGIQIRAGDWTFDDEEEQSLRMKEYMPFFDCARQIEDFAKPTPDSKVVWYLISDSTRLRKRALKRFGAEKLVTLTTEHKHVACNVVDCSSHNQTQTLLDAVGDLLSLSQTDYQVLTQKSGFGKVATSLAIDHWHSIYWPDRPIGKGSFHNGKEPRKIVSTIGNCTQADYVLLEDLSDGWSGVR